MKGRLGNALAGLLLATCTFAGPAAAHAQNMALPPGAVFTAINNVKVADDNADWIELEDGVVSTFWYGHEFDVAGRHFYTGFVWNAPDRGAQNDEDFPAPDAQVKLAQATFERTHPGQTPAYVFYSVERKTGAFGAYEKPENVDGSRKAVEHHLPDGRMVLAVPTATFENGATIKGYSLFLFTLKKEYGLKEWLWSYVGQVQTGFENSAACDEGAVMPCIDSDGELSFADVKDSLPRVKVRVSGTTIEGPGKTRTLGTADNATYVYDAGTMLYMAK
ncbi:hypothetical protein FQZ97_581510 [compost metagenome]